MLDAAAKEPDIDATRHAARCYAAAYAPRHADLIAAMIAAS